MVDHTACEVGQQDAGGGQEHPSHCCTVLHQHCHSIGVLTTDHWEGVEVEEESVRRDEEGRSDKFAEGPFYNVTEENGTKQAYSVHLTCTHTMPSVQWSREHHTLVTLQHVDWPVPVHTRGDTAHPALSKTSRGHLLFLCLLQPGHTHIPDRLIPEEGATPLCNRSHRTKWLTPPT